MKTSRQNSQSRTSSQTKSEQKRAYHRDWTNRNYKKVLVENARRRSERDGLPFDLTEADIEIPATCPILGIPLVRVPGKAESSPTLDKLIPALGYTKKNTWVISHKANRMKADLLPNDLRRLAQLIEREIGSRYGEQHFEE